MKILPVVADLCRADGQTDGHDEANSRFSQVCEKRLKSYYFSMNFSAITMGIDNFVFQ